MGHWVFEGTNKVAIFFPEIRGIWVVLQVPTSFPPAPELFLILLYLMFWVHKSLPEELWGEKLERILKIAKSSYYLQGGLRCM